MPYGDIGGKHEQGTGSGSCSWNHSKKIVLPRGGFICRYSLPRSRCEWDMAFIPKWCLTRRKDSGNGRNKRVCMN